MWGHANCPHFPYVVPRSWVKWSLNVPTFTVQASRARERKREREREGGWGRDILDTGKPGICLNPTLNRFPGSLIYPHFLAYDQHGRISKKHYEFQKFQEPRAGVEPGSFWLKVLCVTTGISTAWFLSCDGKLSSRLNNFNI